MNLIKCSKGHFYDGDKFASCPHCGTSAPADSVTVSMPRGGSSYADVTVSMPAGGGESVTVARYEDSDPVTVKSTNADTPVTNFGDLAGEAQSFAGGMSVDDDNRTISYYGQRISSPVIQEPVVGWLVCTEGKYFGQSFCLKSGRNFIGRSPQMDVCLDGEKSVSRERHAVVIYEPSARIFIAQPGDSRELFYVNDDVVLDNVILKPYDVISLGKVNMMMIPCCTKEFAWEDLEKDKEDKEDK